MPDDKIKVLSDDDKIKVISDQLDLLVENKALTKEKRQDVITELETLKAAPDKSKEYKEYADSLSKGLPGVTKGVIGAINAKNDPYAITIATVDIFAAVVTIAGPLTGPFGTLVSALAGMVSTILGAFLPKPESMQKQLEEVVRKIVAEDQVNTLGAVAKQIWVVTAAIGNKTYNYKPLNLQDGNQVAAIDKVWGWLETEGNQSLALWDEVLAKMCKLWIQLVQCVGLMIAHPSTLDGQENKKGLKNILTIFPLRQQLFLDQMRLIKPVVQQRGLYAHLGSFGGGWVLYTAPGQLGSLSKRWKYERGAQWMKTISIHVPNGQLGSSNPQYDLYACVDHTDWGPFSATSPKGVSRYRLDSLGALSDGKEPLLKEHAKYPNIGGGGTSSFGACVDACALPDWEDPNRTRVYTAHSFPGTDYVNIYVVDADNNVKRINWEPHPSAGLAHIRAVVGDIAKSLPDDPDVAALPPHGLYEIIYGGYGGNGKVWVALDNSWKDVPGPWKTYKGIEVDPCYLWVFGEQGIACATHASVIRCKNGVLDSPKWIQADFDELRKQVSKWPPVVDSLYPCADGTLVAMVNTEIFIASYEFKRAPDRIVTSSWLKRGGDGRQVVRMPIPCGPTMAAIMRDLEKQVAEFDNGTWGGLYVEGVREAIATAKNLPG